MRRAEYDQLVEFGAFEEERIELLEGVLVEMNPVGTPHSAAVQALTVLLVPALAGRASVRIQMPFAALDASEPEPDIAIVPLGSYREAHPDRAQLIIEVAESSLRGRAARDDLACKEWAAASRGNFVATQGAAKQLPTEKPPAGTHLRVRGRAQRSNARHATRAVRSREPSSDCRQGRAQPSPHGAQATP